MAVTDLDFSVRIKNSITAARARGRLSHVEAKRLFAVVRDSDAASEILELIQSEGTPDYLYSALYFATRIWQLGEASGCSIMSQAGYNLARFLLAHEAPQDDPHWAEQLLQDLGLSYRRLLICAGDMGFTQAKKYDLEVWAPGVEDWLEVSSISNFRDYQARRMQIRYRPEKGAKPEVLHTLNGSGLALPRTMAIRQVRTTSEIPNGRINSMKASGFTAPRSSSRRCGLTLSSSRWTSQSSRRFRRVPQPD